MRLGREQDLVHLGQARRPLRRLPGPHQHRQQQPDQHRDDANHHQQLDERERRAAAGMGHAFAVS
jgi:hypothetical protein